MRFYLVVRIVLVGTICLMAAGFSESKSIEFSVNDSSKEGSGDGQEFTNIAESPQNPSDQPMRLDIDSLFIDPHLNASDLFASNLANRSISIPLNNTANGTKQIILLSPDALETLESYMGLDNENEKEDSNETVAESKFVVRLARALQHFHYVPVPPTKVLNSEEVIEYQYDPIFAAASDDKGSFITSTPCDSDHPPTPPPHKPCCAEQRKKPQSQFSNMVCNGPVIVISHVQDLKIVNPAGSDDQTHPDLDDMDDGFDIVDNLDNL